MKQLTINAFAFDELSDKAKDKARNWMRECVGESYDWADSTKDDAENVGLKITGWNLDRGSVCTLQFTETHERVAELIKENHGEGCDTRQAAGAYRAGVARIKFAMEDGGMNEEEEQDARSQNEAEFQTALEACYLKMLREAWEYEMSDEGIDETINANDYLFTEQGSRSATLNQPA